MYSSFQFLLGRHKESDQSAAEWNFWRSVHCKCTIQNCTVWHINNEAFVINNSNNNTTTTTNYGSQQLRYTTVTDGGLDYLVSSSNLLSSRSQLVTLPFQSQVCLSMSKAKPDGQLICFIPALVHLRDKMSRKKYSNY